MADIERYRKSLHEIIDFMKEEKNIVFLFMIALEFHNEEWSIKAEPS